MGPARRRRRATTSSRSTWSTRTRRRRSPSSRRQLKERRRAAARHGRGPRGRGDRLAPAARCSSRRCRSAAWSSTRSPATRSGPPSQNTRDLDQRLVDAQETRRILDRLYGYEVSPVLWKKVMHGLSAGRVQSVATRLVVERERERIAFVAASYWDLAGAARARRSFTARLVAVDGVAGRHGPRLRLRRTAHGPRQRWRSTRPAARSLAAGLADAAFAVRSVEEKPYRRSPAAPFMTSTLQQEASRKLRFSAQTTMRVAQRLYENGYITYMRTDSTTLSADGDRGRAGDRPGSIFGARQRPGHAAPVHPQGQERAGGARGDPSVRGQLPHTGRGGAGAVRRRARASTT